jgi:[1-hydroxy-2-(trimethylamino)ethyl]phosphonate dioxygenase
MNAEDVVREIVDLFTRHGCEAYVGEAVSQLEHALQAALLAEIERAPDSLIVAALLHDIGHLLQVEGEDAAERGVDTQHEALGERWLAERFTQEITRPIALHVQAKRYLCTVDPEYRSELSDASERSLRLQGGPMSKEECQAFETDPYFGAAIQLRRWDDAAKIVGVTGLDITVYHRRILIEARRREAEL